MAAFGGQGLIWRIARHDGIPVDLAAARALPSTALFQCEVMADALDRVARRDRLEAAADAQHRKALRGQR